MSNARNIPMNEVAVTIVKAGASKGKTIARKTCHPFAPSIRAASRNSVGIACKPGQVDDDRVTRGAARIARPRST